MSSMKWMLPVGTEDDIWTALGKSMEAPGGEFDFWEDAEAGIIVCCEGFEFVCDREVVPVTDPCWCIALNGAPGGGIKTGGIPGWGITEDGAPKRGIILDGAPDGVIIADKAPGGGIVADGASGGSIICWTLLANTLSGKKLMNV